MALLLVLYFTFVETLVVVITAAAHALNSPLRYITFNLKPCNIYYVALEAAESVQVVVISLAYFVCNVT